MINIWEAKGTLSDHFGSNVHGGGLAETQMNLEIFELPLNNFDIIMMTYSSISMNLNRTNATGVCWVRYLIIRYFNIII